MDVSSFFDAQAEAYHANVGPMTPFHVLTARRIEAGIAGTVVSVGGLWAQFDLRGRDDLDVHVVDVSPRMLEAWQGRGVRTVVGDARRLPFADHSVDHVVFALVLHHITDGGFRASRAQLEAVFTELKRVLKPGGRVWISDFAVGAAVYALEAVSSPITKRLLGRAGIPLVVMHRAETYRGRLAAAGFSDVDVHFPAPESTSAFDVLTPVIGLPWLRVPRAAYPLRPVLVTAVR